MWSYEVVILRILHVNIFHGNANAQFIKVQIFNSFMASAIYSRPMELVISVQFHILLNYTKDIDSLVRL